MSQAYSIVEWMAMDITPKQAKALLMSGLHYYKEEQKFLRARAENIPNERIRIAPRVVSVMAVIKADANRRLTKDWSKWQIGGE